MCLYFHDMCISISGNITIVMKKQDQYSLEIKTLTAARKATTEMVQT